LLLNESKIIVFNMSNLNEIKSNIKLKILKYEHKVEDQMNDKNY